MKEPFSTVSSASYLLAAFFLLRNDASGPSILLAVSLLALAAGSALFHATHSDLAESMDQYGIYATFTSILYLTSDQHVTSAGMELFQFIFFTGSLIYLAVRAYRKPQDNNFRANLILAFLATSLLLLGLKTSSIAEPIMILFGFAVALVLYTVGNVLERNGQRKAGDLLHALAWHPLTALLFFALHYYATA